MLKDYKQGLRVLLAALGGMYLNHESIQLKTGFHDKKTKNVPKNNDFTYSEQCQDLILICMRIYFDLNIPESEKGKYIAMQIALTIHDIRLANGGKSPLVATLIDIINNCYATEATQIIRSQKEDQFGGKEYVLTHRVELLRLKNDNSYGESQIRKYSDYQNIVRESTTFEMWIGVPCRDGTRRDELGAPILENESERAQFEKNEVSVQCIMPVGSYLKYLSDNNEADDDNAKIFIDLYLAELISFKFKQDVINKKGWFGGSAESQRITEEFRRAIDDLCDDTRFEEITGPFQDMPWFKRSVTDRGVREPVFDIRRLLLFYWYKGLLPNIEETINGMNAKLTDPEYCKTYSFWRFEQFKQQLDLEIATNHAVFNDRNLKEFTLTIFKIIGMHGQPIDKEKKRQMVAAMQMQRSQYYDRFNAALIVPLGIDPPPPTSTQDVVAESFVRMYVDKHPTTNPTIIQSTKNGASEILYALIEQVPLVQIPQLPAPGTKPITVKRPSTSPDPEAAAPSRPQRPAVIIYDRLPTMGNNTASPEIIYSSLPAQPGAPMGPGRKGFFAGSQANGDTSWRTRPHLDRDDHPVDALAADDAKKPTLNGDVKKPMSNGDAKRAAVSIEQSRANILPLTMAAILGDSDSEGEEQQPDAPDLKDEAASASATSPTK